MLRAALSLLVACSAAWGFAALPLSSEDVAGDSDGAAVGEVQTAPPATLAAAPARSTTPEVVSTDAETPAATTTRTPLPTVPLRVTVVDGDSGAFLRTASWRIATKPDEPTIGADSGEAAAVVSRDENGHPVDPSWDLVAVAPRGDESSWVRWEAPPMAAALSRYARFLVAVAPLHPEADVRVTLSTSDGSPIAFESVGASVDVGERQATVRETLRIAGGVRLRGVPFVRGAAWALDVGATLRGRAMAGVATGVLAGRPEDGIRAAIRLEPVEEFDGPESNSLCGIGGSG